MCKPEVRIERPSEWLEAHDTVEVYGDEVEPQTANRHGDFQYWRRGLRCNREPAVVLDSANIADDHVTVN